MAQSTVSVQVTSGLQCWKTLMPMLSCAIVGDDVVRLLAHNRVFCRAFPLSELANP